MTVLRNTAERLEIGKDSNRWVLKITVSRAKPIEAPRPISKLKSTVDTYVTNHINYKHRNRAQKWISTLTNQQSWKLSTELNISDAWLCESHQHNACSIFFNHIMGFFQTCYDPPGKVWWLGTIFKTITLQVKLCSEV